MTKQSTGAETLQLDQPWARTADETLDALEVAAGEGLTNAQVVRRRDVVGPNQLRSAQRHSAWQILLNQFKSLIVALLLVAAALSFTFGKTVEGFAVAVVIVINAAIGFITELRAVRSMEALKQLSSVEARVRRNGKVGVVPAEKLVPGDIVLMEGGDVVTADLRLIAASKLQADESTLTGESTPVSKQVKPLAAGTTLAERSNMMFKGTAVTRGAGEGVVVATGMDTELGHISALVEEAEEEVTPLEKRLDQLGRRLAWVTLGIAVVVAAIGIASGREVQLIIETAIALAVATVPEGLPIVATVALARGMWRMAQRNALINRLSSVETLGATTVICTDKTGTLTENRMTVTEIMLDSGAVQVTGEGLDQQGEFRRNGQAVEPGPGEPLRSLLEVAALCNNATITAPEEDTRNGADEAVGEPEEVALLIVGAKAGISRSQLVQRFPEKRKVAFDPDVKLMATCHEDNGRYRVAVKGAPNAVLAASATVATSSDSVTQTLDETARREWSERSERMAGKGLRLMALAQKHVDALDSEPYEDLTWLGVVGFLDPPREEVRPALVSCQQAGVRVVMVTGDHPVTARNIGLAVGLVDDPETPVVLGQEIKSPAQMDEQERQRIRQSAILARFSPAQKLDLIALHQEAGAVVAMTGDGVNDAPAMKKADIGVSMGRRGTQVAKEAADMVLKDDAFGTIVTAIEQGRVIFENIRRFVVYLLSCNISEIMVVSLAALASAPLPLRPLQILFLNLVTDVFPALALGVGEGDQNIMRRPPRDPQESIVTQRHWWEIALYGMVITASVLAAFALAYAWLDANDARAVTIAFLTLAFAQLWHVFNMREAGSPVLRNEITANRFVWGALALCIGLLLAAVYLPVLSGVLSTVDPGWQGWLLVASASLVPVLVGPAVQWLLKLR